MPIFIEMAEYCMQHQIPVWIGGMFETGIGRASNLRFAACFPNARAHDLSPSKRYFVDDLVQNPIDMNQDGLIVLPTDPVTLDAAHFQKYQKEIIIKRKDHA